MRISEISRSRLEFFANFNHVIFRPQIDSFLNYLWEKNIY